MPSGLQKDVFSLYRRLLRAARAKDDPEIRFVTLLQHPNNNNNNNSTCVRQAQQTFRHQAASVQRNEFQAIEYRLRKGEKQLKLLQMPGVTTLQRATTTTTTASQNNKKDGEAP